MVYTRKKAKKEYRCSCGKTYLKWQGICSECKKAGAIQEYILVPAKARPTTSQRTLQQRAKRSERSIAKRMTEVDGPDPVYKNVTTSTGRVGHITGMRIDAISRTYVTENKNRKMPTWLINAWVLINQRGKSFNKNVLLHVEPPNMPKDYPIDGRLEKLGTMAIIAQSHHEELIKNERLLQDILDEIYNGGQKYSELQDRIWELKDRYK
jgi:hypothetical protein